MTKQIGYELHRSDPRRNFDSDIAELFLHVSLGETCDAAAEYDSDPKQYYLERLQTIRAAGESAKYFRKSSYREAKFTLRWLSSTGNYVEYGTEWFAMRIDDASFNDSAIKLLAKLYKATNAENVDVTPVNVLSALHSMGARRVKYIQDAYDAWSYESEPTLDDIAMPAEWIAAREQQTATNEA